LLFIVDIAFLLANLTKLEDGGWLPLVSGLIIYWLMQTWQSGRASVMARLLREQKPVRDFVEELKSDPPVRVTGTAIFLDAKASGIPRALLNNIKFNRVMHERVVLLTVVTRELPRISAVQAPDRDPGMRGHRAGGGAGGLHGEAEYHGDPAGGRDSRRAYDPESTTYFLSREELLPGQRSDLPPLRRRAFMQMARSAQVIADLLRAAAQPRG
jgi:KUP system potassium uptake protein